VTALAALEACLQGAGRLPVNVKARRRRPATALCACAAPAGRRRPLAAGVSALPGPLSAPASSTLATCSACMPMAVGAHAHHRRCTLRHAPSSRRARRAGAPESAPARQRRGAGARGLAAGPPTLTPAQVFVEGEEEIGSPGLADLLRRHSALLGADFVISTDSGQISETQGGVLLGLRGMAAFEVEARTLAADVHSGAAPPRPWAPAQSGQKSSGAQRATGHGKAGAQRCAARRGRAGTLQFRRALTDAPLRGRHIRGLRGKLAACGGGGRGGPAPAQRLRVDPRLL